MRFNPYIGFKGNCEAALNFYKDILDAEITTFMRYSEAPSEVMKVQDEHKNLVMHATLEFKGNSLMLCDNFGEHLTIGNAFSLSINAGEDEVVAIFNSLADDGTIVMPYKEAFWGGNFGMLTDKFGVQWMVTSEHKQA